MEQTNLNLIPQKDKPVINASQYDNGRVVRFNLKHGEDEFTLTGNEVISCNIRKVDGHIVTITPTVVADKTYVDVYLNEQANACFGDQIGELVITMSDTVIGTCNFILRVEKSPMVGGVTSASDIDNLTTQITEIVVDVLGDNYYTKDETDSAIAAAIAEVPTFDPENYYDKSDVNTLLSAKADSTSVYTKSETNDLLSAKADSSSVYTKSETNDLLSAKANASDVYTKSEVDTSLSLKANAADVYTKTEVDNKIDYMYPLNADYISAFQGLLNGTYGYVDMGTLTNWVKDTTSLSVTVFRSYITGRKAGSSNFSCNKYTTIAGGRNNLINNDKSIASWNTTDSPIVAVRDDSLSGSTEAAFTTAMSGVYLIYELATAVTPTITQAQLETLIKAFNNNMVNVILKV